MANPSPVATYHTDTYAAISPSLPHLSTVGKNAVISGGGLGIGLSIATSLAKSGISNLSLLGRRENILLEAKAALNKAYPNTNVLIFVADIVNKPALDQAFECIKSTIGPIDVLVANAGFLPNIGPVSVADLENWYTGFDINVKGNLNLIRAFLPVAAKNAAIINISSAAAHIPHLSGYSGYQCSKLAGTKLFEYLHHEHPEFFVLNVHPGVLKTEMSAKAEEDLTYDGMELPGDFVNWAISPDAKFLNGKLIWAHWDVNELIAMKQEIEGTNKFTLGLLGWP